MVVSIGKNKTQSKFPVPEKATYTRSAYFEQMNELPVLLEAHQSLTGHLERTLYERQIFSERRPANITP